MDEKTSAQRAYNLPKVLCAEWTHNSIPRDPEPWHTCDNTLLNCCVFLALLLKCPCESVLDFQVNQDTLGRWAEAALPVAPCCGPLPMPPSQHLSLGFLRVPPMCLGLPRKICFLKNAWHLVDIHPISDEQIKPNIYRVQLSPSMCGRLDQTGYQTPRMFECLTENGIVSTYHLCTSSSMYFMSSLDSYSASYSVNVV